MRDGAEPAPGSPRIRAIVVDDEALSRSNIVTLLRRDPKIDIVAECDGGSGALERIRTLRPDLAFLDVEMPECDGFDVLEMLGVDRPAAIVFVTAHATYAIRAFDAGALDYLLKPFDDERFARALQRAKDRLREVVPRHVEQFAIKTATGIEFLRVSEIDWIEAADYYSRLHVSARTQLLRRSMAELERDLDPTAFCRIHRSTIVRLDAVRGLALSEDGEHDIVLNDGTRLRCSRRYRKLLQSRLPARPSKNR